MAPEAANSTYKTDVTTKNQYVECSLWNMFYHILTGKSANRVFRKPTKRQVPMSKYISDLCPDCGAELVTKDTYGMGGDECWDECPECERGVD